MTVARRTRGTGAPAWALAAAVLTAAWGCAPAPEAAPDERPPLVVRATVDRSLVRVGETLTYTVELDWAPDVQPVIPEFGRAIEGLRISDQRVDGPDEIDGRATQRASYQLVGDRVGSYEIPGASVHYLGEDGTQGQATTGPILVEVSSSLDGAGAVKAGEDGAGDGEAVGDAPAMILDDRLRDIREPYRIRDPNVASWLVVAGVLFAAVAVAWIVFTRLRWRAPEPPPPPPDPDEVALRALARLRGDGLLERGELQPFAFGLSSILRDYLGQRFGFPAPEWTTTEILAGLPAQLRGAKREGELRQVLDATDLVKYAGRDVGSRELERLADVCERLVEETRPVEGSRWDDHERDGAAAGEEAP